MKASKGEDCSVEMKMIVDFHQDKRITTEGDLNSSYLQTQASSFYQEFEAKPDDNICEVIKVVSGFNQDQKKFYSELVLVTKLLLVLQMQCVENLI